MIGLPRTTAPAVALAAGALAIAASGAIAGVAVYKNNLSSKREARELRHSEGKRCQKTWRRKAKSLRVVVKRGPGRCGYRPPVQADSPGPDHAFRAKEKLLKQTPKAVRRGAYLAVAVRSDKRTGYELRVFPRKHKFELLRSPSGGGPQFPAKGKSSKIKGTNHPNVLDLKAVGSKVIAAVNGAKLAKLTDTNPAEVGGTMLQATIGHRAKGHKPVVATIDDLKVQVPKP